MVHSSATFTVRHKKYASTNSVFINRRVWEVSGGGGSFPGRGTERESVCVGVCVFVAK